MPDQVRIENLKVLFVDDEKNILSALRRLLIDEEFEVLTAESGQQGLDVLRQVDNIGLIVSDQRMPEMSGAEFLARAREILPHVPRVILTGHADVQAAIDAINRGGARRYLKKPWDDNELTQTIREELGHFLLVEENRRLHGVIEQQNSELQDWNARLKSRVLEQTSAIRQKNEELYAQNVALKHGVQATINALANLIELRDRALRQHGQTVARLVECMVVELGLAPKDASLCIEAARLHDIGKIGSQHDMLECTEDDLDQADLLEYLQHAVRGQLVLDSVEELRPAGVLIRHHHEHYDGSGYPDGLGGDRIPLGSRLISLASYADHTLSGQQKSKESFLQDLHGQSGSRFDPDLIPVLEKVLPIWSRDGKGAGRETLALEPKNLRSGMTLAKDLYSGTGLLLLKKDTQLDPTRIESILRYHRLDPFPGKVSVWAGSNDS